MPKQKKIKAIPETHQTGHLSIEKTIDGNMIFCDFGIQMAEDGRIWICIDGEAYLRFSPKVKDYRKEEEVWI